MKLRACVPLALVVLAAGLDAKENSKAHHQHKQHGPTNPVIKVLEMLATTEKKVIADGKAATMTYTKFEYWCKGTSKKLHFEIKTGKRQKKDQLAVIAAQSARMASKKTQQLALTTSYSADQAALKKATELRKTENKAFLVVEKTLKDSVSTIERTLGIMQRGLRGKRPSLLQVQHAMSSATELEKVLSELMDASELTDADTERLSYLALRQEDKDDIALDNMKPDTFKTKGGSVVGVLKTLLGTARSNLQKAQMAEAKSQGTFDLLKSSLDHKMKISLKGKASAKTAYAAAKEAKAAAQGDLALTNKGLIEDEKSLAALKKNCLAKANDFKVQTKTRDDEIKALTGARKAIAASTGLATKQVYNKKKKSLKKKSFQQEDVSLLQTTSVSSGSPSFPKLVEVLRQVREMAGGSADATAFAQLSRRLSSAVHQADRTGADPFKKVKGLLSDMIQKLLKEAHKDATHNKYCVQQMTATKDRKNRKASQVSLLTVAIDKMKATGLKLKQEIATLQKELKGLASEQATLDKLRAKEKKEYLKDKADLEQGIKGVGVGLKILRNFYTQATTSKKKVSGTSSSIIGLLEVAEGDMTKALAELIAGEKSSADTYRKTTSSNKVAKATKSESVQLKTKEMTKQASGAVQKTQDRNGIKAQLDALKKALSLLKAGCIAQPEAYKTRKERRDKEIAGLKDALTALSSDSS